MSSATKTVSRPGHHSTADGSQSLSGFVSKLALAYKVSRERRALLGMSEAALKDVGLSTADAYREGSRSVWDLPNNR